MTSHKISLKTFVSNHKEEIDEFILENKPDITITNLVREEWLKTNERLRTWAKWEGVRL